MSPKQHAKRGRNEPIGSLPLDLCSAVDAALHYADFARGAQVACPEVWQSRYPARTAGDRVIDLQETETRPQKCMQILAAEVRRLRAEHVCLVHPGAPLLSSPNKQI